MQARRFLITEMLIAGILTAGMAVIPILAGSALLAGSAPSFAQAAGDDRTLAGAIDQAVRSGDFGRAAAIVRKSAEQGNAEAQYRLASFHRLGRGVAQDDELAFKWMKAAAEQNHAAAQFNLGRMYLAGHGAAADAGAARTWIQKAASQGYAEASQALATKALWDAPRRAAEARAGAQPAQGGARGAAKAETKNETKTPASRPRRETGCRSWRTPRGAARPTPSGSWSPRAPTLRDATRTATPPCRSRHPLAGSTR
jgi:TPR repeat protein